MEYKFNKSEFNPKQFEQELGSLANKISGYKHEQSNLIVYASILVESEIAELTQAIADHTPVAETKLRIYRVVPEEYSKEYVKNLVDFSILGFRKISPYYERGRKSSAEYKCIDKDEVIVDKTFTDILKDDGRQADLQIHFRWYNEDGTVGMEKIETGVSYNRSQWKTEKRKRRARAIDFLESEADGTPLEPIMKAIKLHYLVEMDHWITHDLPDFRDAILNETDPTILAYLSIKVPLTSLPHLSTEIRNSIFYQIGHLDTAAFMATVVPTEQP